jgi:hypothetical protein
LDAEEAQPPPGHRRGRSPFAVAVLGLAAILSPALPTAPVATLSQAQMAKIR